MVPLPSSVFEISPQLPIPTLEELLHTADEPRDDPILDDLLLLLSTID